jgi:phosphoribosyl 1,2-cyclic phosphodiesterase
MTCKFSVLASGSRANATVVSWNGVSVLIDCGLSWKELKVRMEERGFSPDELAAVIITHEHYDHVAGLKSVIKQRGLPVFASKKTARHLKLDKLETFSVSEPLAVAGLNIQTFPTSHDAVDPIGLKIETPFGAIGVVTDLGQVTSAVREQMKGLRAVILESNHDLDLLEIAPYPRSLKSRISSRRGHLSNAAAGAFLEEICSHSSELEVVVAAHVSEKANDPILVEEVLLAVTERVGARLVVANQKVATEPFFFHSSPSEVRKTREIPRSALHRLESIL